MRTSLQTGVAIAALALCASFGIAMAQDVADDGPPQRPRQPPQAALNACRALTANATCSFAAQGRTITGSCFAPQGRPLACRPAGGQQRRRGGGGPPDRPLPDDADPDRGGAIASSRVSTSSILCSVSHNANNQQLARVSRYEWTCGDGQRQLTGNGIPNHVVGAFPNPGNPNRISERPVSFHATLAPHLMSGPAATARTIGFALNGIKFDPGTAEACDDGCANGGRGRQGEWQIEALNQSYFDFGVDDNNAHVQPDGSYHYHGIPTGLIAQLGRPDAITIIGFAIDGFPIYGPYGYASAMDSRSPVRMMRSSYRMKATPDAGRPPIAVAPMGTFMQDYEFVAGLGDLDECNGRTGVTPEFPNRTYHYYVTPTYPYVQRCVKGDISAAAFERRDRSAGATNPGSRGPNGQGPSRTGQRPSRPPQ